MSNQVNSIHYDNFFSVGFFSVTQFLRFLLHLPLPTPLSNGSNPKQPYIDSNWSGPLFLSFANISSQFGTGWYLFRWDCYGHIPGIWYVMKIMASVIHVLFPLCQSREIALVCLAFSSTHPNLQNIGLEKKGKGAWVSPSASSTLFFLFSSS